MEPCSILELSKTVLSLSLTLYNFIKAFRNVPREVQEYLSVLESTRLVFEDVQSYAEAHLHSPFFEDDGIRLTVVGRLLQDCKHEFTAQLSYVESLDPAVKQSIWDSSNRRRKWVFGKEALQTLTKKLEKLQNLLQSSITTSSA
jgi:hypothetical protein